MHQKPQFRFTRGQPGSPAHDLFRLRSLLVTSCRDCDVRDRSKPGLYCREMQQDVSPRCRDGAPFCPLGRQVQGIVDVGQAPAGLHPITIDDGTLSVLVPETDAMRRRREAILKARQRRGAIVVPGGVPRP